MVLEFVLTMGSFDRWQYEWSKLEGDFRGSSGNVSSESVNRYDSIQNYTSLAFFPSDEEIRRRIASPIPEIVIISTLKSKHR